MAANSALHDEIYVLMNSASTVESDDIMEKMMKEVEAVPEDVSAMEKPIIEALMLDDP